MRDLFTKDLGWKLFSLLLAAAIWFTANRILHEANVPVGGGSSVTYGNLPVYIVSSASDVHLYRVAPSVVSVTVSGASEVLAGLQAAQIRATVDLTDIDSANDFKRRVDIAVPAGITLVSVSPTTVNVIIPPLPLQP